MRRNLVVLMAFVVGSISLVLAQDGLRFNGYVVNFSSGQRLNSSYGLLGIAHQNIFADITRIRFRPSMGLWQDAYLMLEYEVNATYVSTSIPFQQPATRNPKQLVDLTWNPVQGAHWSIVHFVDRLYFRQITSLGDFTIGRQRISWGTGRVWNPTDLFNPLNPTSYSKIEKDGVDAILAKFRLGDFSDFSVVYNAAERSVRDNYGFRLRTNIAGYDLSVMGGSFDGRPVVGADFAGNLFDAGIRGEGILSGRGSSFNDHFIKYILGIDNQFTEKLYALAEYHYNGEGHTNPAQYEFSKLLNGSILNVGKQYLALQASYLLHPLVTVQGSLTKSFTDGSGYLGGTVAYSAADEMSISIGGQYFFGDPFDEYWYYPSSLYARIDYYF